MKRTQRDVGKAELELIQFDDVTDSAELVALFEKTFGEHATQALKLYYTKDANVSEAEAVAASLARLGGELWYQGGSWHMANIISAAAAAPPVYLYSFAEKVSTVSWTRMICALVDNFVCLGRTNPVGFWTGGRSRGSVVPWLRRNILARQLLFRTGPLAPRPSSDGARCCDADLSGQFCADRRPQLWKQWWAVVAVCCLQHWFAQKISDKTCATRVDAPHISRRAVDGFG
jgi:hypothetical protein